MKKTLFFVACLAFVLTSCSKTEVITISSPEVKEILDYLSGTWMESSGSHVEGLGGENYNIMLSFSVFSEEIKRYSISSEDVYFMFNGKIQYYRYMIESGDINDDYCYYFYVRPASEKIYAYRIPSENEDFFDFVDRYIYYYRIMDEETLLLSEREDDLGYREGDIYKRQ